MTGIVVLPKCYPPSSRETHDNIDTTVFKLLSMTCKKHSENQDHFQKKK